MSDTPKGYRVRVRGVIVGACTTPEREDGSPRIGRLMLHGPALRTALGKEAPQGQKDSLNFLTTHFVFDILEGESDEVCWTCVKLLRVRTAMATPSGNAVVAEGCEVALPVMTCKVCGGTDLTTKEAERAGLADTRLCDCDV